MSELDTTRAQIMIKAAQEIAKEKTPPLGAINISSQAQELLIKMAEAHIRKKTIIEAVTKAAFYLGVSIIVSTLIMAYVLSQ